MTIGVAAGMAGGIALLWFMRWIALPSEALYPLRTLASVLLLYGVTTLLHGSGFLAVFIAVISSATGVRRTRERLRGFTRRWPDWQK